LFEDYHGKIYFSSAENNLQVFFDFPPCTKGQLFYLPPRWN
jgi:YHS domain-containing protein